jgi:hypothetical protein
LIPWITDVGLAASLTADEENLLTAKPAGVSGEVPIRETLFRGHAVF